MLPAREILPPLGPAMFEKGATSTAKIFFNGKKDANILTHIVYCHMGAVID